eukprot:8128142-Karenia_brevis.AAC.1
MMMMTMTTTKTMTKMITVMRMMMMMVMMIMMMTMPKHTRQKFLQRAPSCGLAIFRTVWQAHRHHSG